MGSKYLSTRIMYAVFLYVLLMIIVFLNKPSFAFDKDGKIKSFGIGRTENETTYSLGVLTVVMAVVVFYGFCMIDLMF